MILGDYGLGKETAIQLARRGGKIYITSRNGEKGTAAVNEIKEKSGNENIHCMQLDLALMENIREFSRKFHEAETNLHILINNAKTIASFKKTKDGIEMNMGVNHIGHFLLTNLLMDLLKASTPSRIVIVASEAHNAVKIQKDEFEKIKSFGMWRAFAHSKLANMLFMRELAKKIEGTGITVNALCPGSVSTEGFSRMNLCERMVMWPIQKVFFKSVEIGAETQVMLAVESKLETVTGKYFKDCKVKNPSQAAQNDESASWLWEQSEKMTGL